MTPQQRKLARHALGLPNDAKRSYRNRYTAYPGSEVWRVWDGLCERGLAQMNRGNEFDYFELTEAGAVRALDEGESLDREDFPHAA
jgi:hypothetical protein